MRILWADEIFEVDDDQRKMRIVPEERTFEEMSEEECTVLICRVAEDMIAEGIMARSYVDGVEVWSLRKPN